MAEWDRAYQEMLFEARSIYERDLQAALVEMLYRDYVLALDDIVRMIAEGTMYEQRGAELTNSIMRRLTALASRLGASGDGAVATAAELAVGGHQLAVAAAVDAAGVSIGYTFTDVAAEAVELMMARRGLGLSETFRTLINLKLEGLAPELNSILTRQRIIGRSATEAAKEIAQFLGVNDPAVQALLKSKTVRIASGSRRILSDFDTADARRARSLLFDSYRIAVTETNQAFFAADQQAAARSPVVEMVKWEVSGRHFGLPTSPDVCTAYHLRDWTGLGAGLFHPQSVPLQPHSFCACHTSKVLRRPKDWNKPPLELPDPMLAEESEMRRVLEQARSLVTGTRARNITDNYLTRQTDLANFLVRRGDEVARQVADLVQ